MAKTWILDTETKGTGAHVVPIEQGLGRRSARDPELALVDLGGTRPAPPGAAPPAPLLFTVVDVMSSRVLAERVPAREAIRALEGLRSVLDARVSVWPPGARRARLLSLADLKRLWAFRGGLDQASASAARSASRS